MNQKRAQLAAFVTIGVCYIVTAARHLAHADSPEFVALSELGGVAHPPGYPTVVLFYRAFSWIPGDPRLVTSLVTAAVGLFAIWLVFRACRAWGLGSEPSLVAAVLTGLNSQVWLVHTHAEVFAFNDAFAAAILLFCAPGGPLRGRWRMVVLGLLAGLGIGAHHSIVLLAPVGLWGVYRGWRESEGAIGWLLASGLALIAGLSVYAYLLVADSTASFGRIGDIQALVDHFLRRDYGTTQLGAEGEMDPLGQLSFWFVESATASLIIGLGLLFVGIRHQLEESGERRGGWLALAGAWWLAGPVFIAMFNIEPLGPQAEIVKRFHVLGFIVGAPFVAGGWSWVRGLELRREVAFVVLGVTVAGMIGIGAYRVSALYDTSIEDNLLNTMATMPENAVVVGQGDHRYFGFQYYQEVEERRADMLYVDPMALAYDWYVDRLNSEAGFDVPRPTRGDDGRKKVDFRAFLDAAIASGRPVYVTRDFLPEILGEYPMVPEGAGWRLLVEGERPPPPGEVFERNREIYADFQFRSPPPEYRWNPWGWSLFNLYTRVWQDVMTRCDLANAPCGDAARKMLERYPDL